MQPGHTSRGRWRIAAVLTVACLRALRHASAQTIPAAHATTLSGQAILLPDALRGHPAVLILGFSKASRDAVAAWERRIDTNLHTSSVAYYQVAMLGGAPRLLRGMIVGQIKSSVSEPARPHFLIVTESDAPWRVAAHYARPNDAYVLLLDATGTIRWQTSGDASDDAYLQLKQHLAALAPNP